MCKHPHVCEWMGGWVHSECQLFVLDHGSGIMGILARAG